MRFMETNTCCTGAGGTFANNPYFCKNHYCRFFCHRSFCHHCRCRCRHHHPCCRHCPCCFDCCLRLFATTLLLPLLPSAFPPPVTPLFLLLTLLSTSTLPSMLPLPLPSPYKVDCCLCPSAANLSLLPAFLLPPTPWFSLQPSFRMYKSVRILENCGKDLAEIWHV